MKKLYSQSILLLLTVYCFGQYPTDALRFSQTFPGGTARTVAMGGAFGALGGDFYSATQNPAGLGFYRSSEFTFTPELYIANTKTIYNGSSTWGDKYKLNFNNLGWVSAIELNSGNWKRASIAVGFNKIQNFSNNIHIQGNNYSTSLVDYYAELANYAYDVSPADPLSLVPFEEQLFYEGYLMSQTTDGYYYNELRDSINNDIGVNQSNSIEQRGKMNEWVFSAGFNYNDMLYFGATLSILPVEFYEKFFFGEKDLTSNMGFRFNETRDLEGTGIGAKFGIIVKPIHILRIGLSYHTSTYFEMEESFDANLFSDITNAYHYPLDEYGYELDGGTYNYIIKTPAKAIASLGVLLGQYVLLSGDFEYIDYTKNEILRSSESDNSYTFDYENSVIRNIYRATINGKGGVEVRFDKLYLRGGFGYFGSPYALGEPNVNAYQLSYSGGIGVRGPSAFIDFAFYNKRYTEDFTLYNSDYVPPSVASIDHNSLKLMATVGFRF